MIVAVHQPHYMPYLGYFDKMDTADMLVLLNTVQFEKGGYQNRNKIKKQVNGNGQPHWLTAPVRGISDRPPIADVKINDSTNWRQQHLRTLGQYYAKAPFFNDVIRLVDEFLDSTSDLLEDICHDTIEHLYAEIFGSFPGGVLWSSFIPGEESTDDPSERLAIIVAAIKGTVYLSGAGAREYLDETPFTERGIRVVYQDFQPAAYQQLHGEFIPNLSAIDALMNIGPEATRDLIREGRKTEL